MFTEDTLYISEGDRMKKRHCKHCNGLYYEGDQNYCSYECYILADWPEPELSEEDSEE